MNHTVDLQGLAHQLAKSAVEEKGQRIYGCSFEEEYDLRRVKGSSAMRRYEQFVIGALSALEPITSAPVLEPISASRRFEPKKTTYGGVTLVVHDLGGPDKTPEWRRTWDAGCGSTPLDTMLLELPAAFREARNSFCRIPIAHHGGENGRAISFSASWPEGRTPASFLNITYKEVMSNQMYRTLGIGVHYYDNEPEALADRFLHHLQTIMTEKFFNGLEQPDARRYALLSRSANISLSPY